MSTAGNNYSPLRTLEEEGEEDDLDLGPIRKVRYKKSAKNRYHDLFQQYNDLEAQGRNTGSWAPEQGTKRGICLAFSMGVVLVTLVIAAVLYVSSGEKTSRGISDTVGNGIGDKSGVSLDDVLNGKFYPRGFNGTWISDTEIQYFNAKGDLVIYDVISQNSTLVIPAPEMASILGGNNPIRCSISADRNFILLSYDSQRVYRHSSYAKFTIFDARTRRSYPLVPPILVKKNTLLQLAEWGPKDNSIVYVYENNIYYKASAINSETLQITTDGKQLVSNGITDWVYEEEVFSSNNAVWFSPDGSHLAFVTFNDTLVDEIHFEIYGEPGADGFQYPMIESIPYPKAGRTNPTAKVSIVDLRGNLAPGVKFNLQKDLEFPEVPTEHYVAGLVWASRNEVLVVTLNRHQNDSRHHLCSMSGTCRTLLIDQQMNGWIVVEMPKVSSNGNSFLTLTSQFQGGKWYRHIVKYNRNSVNKVMTSGDFPIDNILKWDEVNHRIYFTAPFYNPKTKTLVPSTTHLYYVDDSGNNSAEVTCITCNSVTSTQVPCDCNAVDLSEGGSSPSYFVQNCNGPSVPEVYIKSLLTTPPSEPILWQDNAELKTKMSQVTRPIIQNYDIPIENNLSIKARIQIPPNFNPKKKYPLLVDVYAGPTSQRIADGFSVGWPETLTTSHDVIYAYIDGRGSGRQSDDLRFQIYRRLGTVEVDDQIQAVEWLTSNVAFIDPKRVAIWGWSYGGFATATIMAKEMKGVFKCGISVAPVTNWAYYDTIYTERYMGLPTPEDNLNAYNNSDITNNVENFRHKKFYLVHGTADDNVHYQNSMQLSRALEKADILFRQTSYPDENHGLGSIRKHLYHSLEDFLFTQCF